MEALKSGPHKGRKPYGIDVCETCMGVITYGTTGDWSAYRGPASVSDEQRLADNRHIRTMVRNLGTNLGHVTMGGETSNDDGSFSSSGCEACGARSCTVYPATAFYRIKG